MNATGTGDWRAAAVMKILYVYGKTKKKDYVYTLRKLGYEVEEYFGSQSDHWADSEEIQQDRKSVV